MENKKIEELKLPFKKRINLLTRESDVNVHWKKNSV